MKYLVEFIGTFFLMTISTEPIASGGMTPSHPLITVQPMVVTRKNVPMNSTRYFIVGLSLPQDSDNDRRYANTAPARRSKVSNKSATNSGLVIPNSTANSIPDVISFKP